jgi:hypothetical protein
MLRLSVYVLLNVYSKIEIIIIISGIKYIIRYNWVDTNENDTHSV